MDVYYATGRRKNSTARVRLYPGKGVIRVNNRELLAYFKREVLKMVIEQPFESTQTMGKFDVNANISGGGLSGQAEALRLGIARALLEWNEELRPELREGGYLTRDPREVERKKYGRPKARKRFQFSKR
ncbi:MAG: 30S ribosomal protein S9 [Calditrichia bacterium]